ncbi:hypothetical protein IWQ47_005288, partial [Aquimarina sp. EL_43]
MKQIILIIFILIGGSKIYSQRYLFDYSEDIDICCDGVRELSRTKITRVFNGTNVIDTYDILQATSPFGRIYSVQPTRVITFFEMNCLLHPRDGGGVRNCTNIADTQINYSSICGNGTGNYDAQAKVTNLEGVLDIPTGTLREKCIEENIILKADNDCHNYRYEWYYQINSNNPIKINSATTTIGQNSQSIPLTSFLPSNYLGAIRISSKVSINNGSSFDYDTNTIVYDITTCSPKLDGPIIDIQPSCSNSINLNDNDNGSFTVTFDRELDDTKQEKMNLQVYRQVGSIFDGYESKVLTKSDFTGASYTWDPKNLPGGIYKLFWQTKSNNEGFDDINTVPDAYDESNPFTLTAPPTLSVSGTPSPVQCFGGNDGSITVTPNGGTPGTPPT